MIKIAIIEDEQIHTDLLADYLRTWGKEHGKTVSIQEFSSAESFLFIWEETNDFDVLFVDIQMRDMNGVEMAKKVRERDGKIAIVFTTGIIDYMATGYEVEALHYLLKPVSMEGIGQCMDKVVRRRHREAYVLVHGKEETIRIPVERISYVEARGHGCVIETHVKAEACRQIEVTESISEMERRLVAHGKFALTARKQLSTLELIHLENEMYPGKLPVEKRSDGEYRIEFRHCKGNL